MTQGHFRSATMAIVASALIASPAGAVDVTDDPTELWNSLVDIAEEAYQAKHAEIEALAESNSADLNYFDFDSLVKDVVYHQMYAQLKCSLEHRANSQSEIEDCFQQFMGDYLRGSNLVADLHAVMPERSTICLSQAWMPVEQTRFPPFDVLKYDDIRLQDMGVYVDCMSD